MAELMYC